MGPGRMQERSAVGMNDSIALNRSTDSRASCESRASVGDSSAACWKGTGWWRRFMGGAGRKREKSVHFIITDASLAKSRAVHLSGTKLVLAMVSLSLVLMLMAAVLYHWVFLKGARERWPVVGTLVRFVVQDEFEQRDRFMRENLDAMARRL